MSIDLTKLSPAPWRVEKHEDGPVPTAWVTLEAPSGKVIADTLNSEVAEICEDVDEDSVYRWDAQGTADLGFAALARNAFDVMMRRGWNPVEMPSSSNWGVADGGEPESIIKGSDGLCIVADDPFTALVEADQWYTENVEKGAAK